jgi:hypothetical protein
MYILFPGLRPFGLHPRLYDEFALFKQNDFLETLHLGRFTPQFLEVGPLLVHICLRHDNLFLHANRRSTSIASSLAYGIGARLLSVLKILMGETVFMTRPTH